MDNKNSTNLKQITYTLIMVIIILSIVHSINWPEYPIY